MKKFDLLDRIMKQKGLYEEEAVADGTPAEGETKGKKDVSAPEEDKKLTTRHNTDRVEDEDAVALKDFFDASVEVEEVISEDTAPVSESWIKELLKEDEVTDGAEPEGQEGAEAKKEAEKTIEDKAEEGSGNSPAAKVNEQKSLKKFKKLMKEAEEAEEKAEKVDEKVEKKEKDGECAECDELKEVARILRKKAKHLREEAEEMADEVADEKEEEEKEGEEEAVTEQAEEAAEEKEEEEKEEEKEEEEKDETADLKEWIKLVSENVIKEEEAVADGTPADGGEFKKEDDEDYEKRKAEAAPTTEDELQD